MGLLESIVLGVVQGLTEFLPISSTAHLRILPALLGWDDPGAPFTAAIQLGTLLAVLLFFRRELAATLVGWTKGLRGGEAARSPEATLGWAIALGSIPIVVCGVLFQDRIEREFRSLQVVAITLIALALLLAAADRWGRRERGLQSVRVRDGLIVGLWQALALVPGASRSGSTITGALLVGLDRATAARFSFLLSVPSILMAGVYSLYRHREALLQEALVPILVANAVSFGVGYASIAFLIRYLQQRSTLVFVVYRILLGLAILALLASGRLHPMQGIS